MCLSRLLRGATKGQGRPLQAWIAGFLDTLIRPGRRRGLDLEVVVETTETLIGCPTWGVVATAHGRRDHLVRDIPSADRPSYRSGASGCGAERSPVWQADLVRDPPEVGRRGNELPGGHGSRSAGTNSPSRPSGPARSRLEHVMRAIRTYGIQLIEAEDRFQCAHCRTPYGVIFASVWRRLSDQ